jgi:hypothetical protein
LKCRRPPHTNDELIAALAALATEPKQFPTPDDDDGTVYLPEIHRTSYAMNPVILCSALFGIARAKAVLKDGEKTFVREYLERVFKTTNGATIEYHGKELAQDDLTVLLGLLNKHWGMATSCELEFAPSTFCTHIGWSDSKHNVFRLKECLLRLRKAILIVRSAKKEDDAEMSKLAKAIGKGWTLGFLSDLKWDGLSQWSVQIDSRMCQLFKTSPTYLIAAKRKALTEGLQTWLYGYIEANTCVYAVSVEKIHEACGSTSSLKEFSRQVRDALPKLVEIGVVRDISTVSNGKVAIFKVLSARPKSSKR